MAADELGGRVHHHVGAVLEGAAQVRRGQRRVDDQRHAGGVGRLARGLRGRPPPPTGWRRSRCRRPWSSGRTAAAKAAGSSAATKVVSMPRRRSDTSSRVWVPPYRAALATMWSPAPARAVNTQQLRGLAARGGHRADPTFEARHALLEGGHGGVGDPGVDVAVLLQGEQIGRVGGVLEHEAGGLVDGYGPRPGGGIGPVAGVDGPGPEPPNSIAHIERS